MARMKGDTNTDDHNNERGKGQKDILSWVVSAQSSTVPGCHFPCWPRHIICTAA